MSIEQLAITVTAQPENISIVRRFVTAALPSFEVDTDRDVVALLTTELTSNAFDTDSGEVTVTVRAVGGRLRVEVRDHGYGRPEMMNPAPYESGGGRGLRIVDHLADRWGVDQFLPGKIVWFELGSVVSGEQPSRPDLRFEQFAELNPRTHHR